MLGNHPNSGGRYLRHRPMFHDRDAGGELYIEGITHLEADLAEESRAAQATEEEWLKKYNGLNWEQVQVIKDKNASIDSVIEAFQVSDRYIDHSKSLWNLLDFVHMVTALKHDGLDPATRDSIIAAPIKLSLGADLSRQCAMDVKDYYKWYLGETPENARDRSGKTFNKEYMFLDPNDNDETAKETLQSQLEDLSRVLSPTQFMESPTEELSERGKEINALRSVAKISHLLFTTLSKQSLAHKLPRDLPDKVESILPEVVKPHAADQWRLTSDAFQEGSLPGSKEESLSLAKRNMYEMARNWGQWRTRGSREEYLQKCSEEGNIAEIRAWFSKDSKTNMTITGDQKSDSAQDAKSTTGTEGI